MGSSSSYGGEVFECAAHGVVGRERVVYRLAAEDAGVVAGFPFGSNWLGGSIAFKFSLGATGFADSRLVGIVGSPAPISFYVCILVGLIVRSTFGQYCGSIFRVPLALPFSLLLFGAFWEVSQVLAASWMRW